MRCRYAPSGKPDEWSFDDQLLSLNFKWLSKLPDKQQAFFSSAEIFPMSRAESVFG